MTNADERPTGNGHESSDGDEIYANPSEDPASYPSENSDIDALVGGIDPRRW